MISVSGVDTCGPGSLYSFTVTATPLPTEVISSTATICAGAAAATFTTTATGSPTSYSWSVLGTGWSGSSSTSTLSATVGTGAGTIIVNGTNACGTGPNDTLTVTPGNPPGAATTIVVPTPLCAGSTGVFTTPAVSGATSYTWNVSGTGWSGTSTTNSITVTIGTGTGTITVTPVNSCGNGTSFSLNSLVPTAAPTATFSESTHTTADHVNVTVTYTGAAPGGTTYSWTFSGGTPATSSSPGPVLVHWNTPGTYTITLTVDNGGCTATYTDTVHVTSGVGIKELNAATVTADIVPNPNEGSFDILFGQSIYTGVTVKLSDMTGRVVYNNDFTVSGNNKISIVTNQLPAGTYAASISANGKTITQKVTITR